MNKVVYKYTFPMLPYFELTLPRDARVLTLDVQHELPCLWCLVPLPVETLVVRKFRLVGTGHLFDADDNLDFIGAFQLAEGNLVFHLFEIKTT